MKQLNMQYDLLKNKAIYGKIKKRPLYRAVLTRTSISLKNKHKKWAYVPPEFKLILKNEPNLGK